MPRAVLLLSFPSTALAKPSGFASSQWQAGTGKGGEEQTVWSGAWAGRSSRGWKLLGQAGVKAEPLAVVGV